MTMKNHELAKLLINLAQLDIDAVHAYEQAISNIDDATIATSLKTFQEDHKRHITSLSVEIKRLGETPPEDKDIKGFLISGFTAVRSLTGTEGALKAMKTNEELTTKTYHNALEEGLPSSIRELIERNYSDEQRHLAYIKKTLDKMSD